MAPIPDMKRSSPIGFTPVAAGLLLALGSATLEAQEDPTFPAEQAAALHEKWTLSNWDDGGDLTRYVFLNMPEFWPHTVIDRTGPVRRLPEAPRPEVAAFRTRTDLGELPLDAYVDRATVDGMIVVHRGQVVFEAYPRMLPWEKHVHMSVAKPFVSTLIAILEERGLLATSRPVDEYLPDLAGSGWEGVAVRDILDMASGIGCLEMVEGAYSDPEQCYYGYEATLGMLPTAAKSAADPYEYLAGVDAHRPPGQAFEYSSVNTFVLGWLVEEVTGRRYAEVLEEEIWHRMGAESDALILAPERGIPALHAGISSTLRDVARFGMLFTPAGRQGTAAPVVTDTHLREIQRGGRPGIFDAARPEAPQLVAGEAPLHNSWQWDWVMRDGDFFKGGFGGQGLYVSPSRDLVIAFFGTFDPDGTTNQLDQVARQLATSGLF